MRAPLLMGLFRAALALLLVGAPAYAAAPPTPLFTSNDPIRLAITGPVMSVVRDPPESDRVVEASLSVQGATPETHRIALSARGITRRRKDVCSFPPLRVEFTERPAATSLFRGQRRLKLVTHCRAQAGFQQYILLEHAAYRLYNQLTPMSFRVRLVTIDYIDLQGRPITSRLGFFIEDVDDMARRNGLRRLETPVSLAQLRPVDAARFAVFQALIGNLDWAMRAGPRGSECCHNSRLIGAEGASGDFIPVPFDFDHAGMVDAPYATPPEAIPVASVRVRRYRGYCRHNAEAQTFVADLQTRRASLLAVLDEAPQLDEETRRKAATYLDGFFGQIDSRDEVAKLLQTCVG